MLTDLFEQGILSSSGTCINNFTAEGLSKPNPCASSRAYACVAMLLWSIVELSVYLSGGL